MNPLKNQVNMILMHHYFRNCSDVIACLDMCPIDSVKIANSLGVDTFARGGQGDENYLYSGSCREHERKLIIEFNQNESSTRQRMVVAYALGLYFSKQKVFISKDFLFNQKSEILDFANELILPFSLLSYYFNHFNVKELEQVARKFGVSKDKVGWRMLELGLNNLN